MSGAYNSSNPYKDSMLLAVVHINLLIIYQKLKENTYSFLYYKNITYKNNISNK